MPILQYAAGLSIFGLPGYLLGYVHLPEISTPTKCNVFNLHNDAFSTTATCDSGYVNTLFGLNQNSATWLMAAIFGVVGLFAWPAWQQHRALTRAGQERQKYEQR